jgi:hypothetical protein
MSNDATTIETNALLDSVRQEEKEYLLRILHALTMQQKALESQNAGIQMQISAIRKKLGLEEKTR